MDFNYARREIYITKSNRTKTIRLTEKENIVFSLMWINKNKCRSNYELSNALYSTEEVTDYEKNNIRRIVWRMRHKGIPIESMYGYGYKLNVV